MLRFGMFRRVSRGLVIRKARVTGDAWLLASWIVVGALVLVAHLGLLWTAWRAPTLTIGLKLLSLVPPLTPVMAWIGGARTGPIAWLVLVVLYTVLRLS